MLCSHVFCIRVILSLLVPTIAQSAQSEAQLLLEKKGKNTPVPVLHVFGEIICKENVDYTARKEEGKKIKLRNGTRPRLSKYHIAK